MTYTTTQLRDEFDINGDDFDVAISKLTRLGEILLEQPNLLTDKMEIGVDYHGYTICESFIGLLIYVNGDDRSVSHRIEILLYLDSIGVLKSVVPTSPTSLIKSVFTDYFGWTAERQVMCIFLANLPLSRNSEIIGYLNEAHNRDDFIQAMIDYIGLMRILLPQTKALNADIISLLLPYMRFTHQSAD